MERTTQLPAEPPLPPKPIQNFVYFRADEGERNAASASIQQNGIDCTVAFKNFATHKGDSKRYVTFVSMCSYDRFAFISESSIPVNH